MVIFVNKESMSTIQWIVAVAAIVYLIAPDLLIGPVDDIFVSIVATITDVILGITKERITVVPNPD